MEPGNASKEDVAVIGKDLSNLEKDFVVIGKDLSKFGKESKTCPLEWLKFKRSAGQSRKLSEACIFRLEVHND